MPLYYTMVLWHIFLSCMRSGSVFCRIENFERVPGCWQLARGLATIMKKMRVYFWLK